NDVRNLKRRLTFRGVEDYVKELESELYAHLYQTDHQKRLTKEGILSYLRKIRTVLHEKHNDLFIQLVDELIGKVKLFGLYFASLDIRQDSSVHKPMIQYIAENTDLLPSNYAELNEDDKLKALAAVD